MVKNKDIRLVMENWKMKSKKEKKNDLPERGFEP